MFGLRYTIFRPHNVYGEFQHIGDKYRNVIGIFMNQLLLGEPLTVFGDGLQTRAFSYVGDILSPMVRCLEMPQTDAEVYNVGGETTYTIVDLAETLRAVTGTRAPIHHLPPRHEVKNAHCNHAKLIAAFGHAEAPITLYSGLARMWDWAVTLGPQAPLPFGEIEITANLPPSWSTP
jgi:UDP-glucose 4-epimerase